MTKLRFRNFNLFIIRITGSTKKTRAISSAGNEAFVDPSKLQMQIVAETERIIISNPSSSILQIGGYYICDIEEKFKFTFPKSFKLDAESSVTIFSCPGKFPVPPAFEGDALLWKNKNGSLRKEPLLSSGNQYSPIELPFTLSTTIGSRSSSSSCCCCRCCYYCSSCYCYCCCSNNILTLSIQ